MSRIHDKSFAVFVYLVTFSFFVSKSYNTLIFQQRAGFLNGPAARNALGQSGLPTHALAHVWTLADVNKVGGGEGGGGLED